MTANDRPLSPHLQIYRLQLTSVMSITHRLTGLCLGLGSIALVGWLMAAAGGGQYFKCAQLAAGSIPGRILLFVWTLCLVYHLMNGVRHLVWDTGRGLELKQVYRSGWFVVVATFVLTIAIWIVAYGVAGHWFAGAQA